MYVLYKFTPEGKLWFQRTNQKNELIFTEHQTDAMHFNTEDGAKHCMEDIMSGNTRVNLSIEISHV